MSRTPGKDSGDGKQERLGRVCRVAYTLDNDQPVRCTIIGDEPFFYMDYEDDDEAFMDILDGVTFDAIDDLDEIERQIAACESYLPSVGRTPELTVQEFLSDADFVTLPKSRRTTDPESIALEIRKILENSRLAKAFLDFADDARVSIKISDQVNISLYDRDKGEIQVHPSLPLSDQVLLVAKELRRVWHHKNGILLHPLTFQPDQAVLINRVFCADATVTMIRIAWELQLAGHRDTWERIETSPMEDLGSVFAREAHFDFRTLNNGQACCMAFESWFLSERCRNQDKWLIQQMLADYQGYVFGNGEETSRLAASELLSRLGAMPFGKNYLSGSVQMVLEDPLFGEVRDRSNANFLWFIKFEKSFRETEQELQDGENTSDQVLSLDLFPDADRKNYENRTDGSNVIPLPSGGRASAKQDTDSSKKAPKGSNPATIVYFQPWTGEG